jgi:prevent-host-death family protein
MKQRKYSMSELGANLAKVIRAAGRGYRILVTSRGEVVAMITGASDRIADDSAINRKLRNMAAQGKILLGRGGCIKPFKSLDLTGVSDQILADRR